MIELRVRRNEKHITTKMSFNSPHDQSPAFTKEEIRKKLFRSPNVDSDRFSDNNPTMTLMNQLQIEHDIEATHKITRKEMHEQRLEQLRKKLKSLSEDDWRYPSIEKLIGLN